MRGKILEFHDQYKASQYKKMPDYQNLLEDLYRLCNKPENQYLAIDLKGFSKGMALDFTRGKLNSTIQAITQ